MATSIFDADDWSELAGDAEVSKARKLLEDLEQPADLLVFAAPGCPNCPHLVRAAVALARASPEVSLEVVNATVETELASRFKIQSVPTTVVDGAYSIVGVRTVEELARILLNRGKPEGEKTLLASLMDAGRLDAAAELLLEGRGMEAFADLWSESTLENRIGLMVVAEEALDRDPGALDDLVPLLISFLLGDDAREGDPALRGDTADLLGRTGSPDARAALQALLQDAHPAVAEAAKESLEEMSLGPAVDPGEMT